jgi:hypothetical protein
MSEWVELRQIVSARFAGKSLLGIVCVFRVSIVLTAVIIACGRLTAGDSAGEYAKTLDRFGLSWEMLRDGRLWHIFTGSLIQSDAGIALSMIVLVVCSLMPCELLAGHRSTLVTFFVCDWIASLCATVGLRILAIWNVGDSHGLLSLPDAGSSAAAHGCLAAACTLLPGRLAWGAYDVLLGITIGLLFVQELDAGVAHLFAVLTGGSLGALVWKPRQARASAQSARNYEPDQEVVRGLE